MVVTSEKKTFSVRKLQVDDVQSVRSIYFRCTRTVFAKGLRKILIKRLWIWAPITLLVLYNYKMMAIVVVAVVLILLPEVIGVTISSVHLYVDKDMKSLYEFSTKPGCTFFVACNTQSGEIVGTVGMTQVVKGAKKGTDPITNVAHIER